MNFTTAGMKLYEREESYESGNVISIGTVCFKAGDWLENTEKIVVDSDNQKEVSMFWNSLYFLDEERANQKMQQSKADYGNFLFESYPRLI